MEAIRKEYFEAVRKEQIDEMLLRKRKKMLGMDRSPGHRAALSPSEPSSEHALAKFAELINAFNHEPSDAFAGILDAARLALNPYTDHLELDAFFESGILRYLMEFFKPVYRSSSLYINNATAITCNLTMGTKEQIDQLLSCSFLNLITEVMVQLDRAPGSATRDVYSNVLWTLANLTGQDLSYRDLVLGHTPLIESLIKYFDHGGPLQLKEAGAFCWLTSNLVRGPPYPSVTVSSRFLERAINQLKRFPEDPDILLNTLHSINDYLSPNLSRAENQIQARDILRSNVMKYVVPQLRSNTDLLVLMAVRILGHLSVNEDEVIESLIELDWGNDVIRLCLSGNVKIAKDSLWLVSNMLNGSTNKMSILDLERLLEVLTETISMSSDDLKLEALHCVKNLVVGANHNILKRIFNFKLDVECTLYPGYRGAARLNVAANQPCNQPCCSRSLGVLLKEPRDDRRLTHELRADRRNGTGTDRVAHFDPGSH